MTVFKTFLKILNKNKFIVILYTGILLIFGVSNFQNSEKNISFTPSKPDIIIVNYDDNKGLTKNLIDYLDKNANITLLSEDTSKIDDALFYREANFVIYIPKGYSNNTSLNIKIKSTGDYMASFASMLLTRYLKLSSIYLTQNLPEEQILNKINNNLDNNVELLLTSHLDSSSLEKTSSYFNFASYSIFATLIYIICIILSVFNNIPVKKRTIISSTNYKKNNRMLLLANFAFSLIVWLFYLLIGFILIGNTLFSLRGIIYIINSLVFTLCVCSIAFFIGSLVQSKNAINGITNVVALGSSFLCGAFVPQAWLPVFVKKIAHIIPTYYYINTNDTISTIESINIESLKPIFINTIIMLIFLVIFVILTNIITRKKRKLA